MVGKMGLVPMIRGSMVNMTFSVGEYYIYIWAINGKHMFFIPFWVKNICATNLTNLVITEIGNPK